MLCGWLEAPSNTPTKKGRLPSKVQHVLLLDGFRMVASRCLTCFLWSALCAGMLANFARLCRVALLRS